jgi:hypothetical protein
MKSGWIGSLIAEWKWKFFKSNVDREICDRIGAQLRHEGKFGYSFSTRGEMNAQTEAMNVSKLLADIEHQAARMPEFYGEAFRHVMRSDLHDRLQLYHQLAERRVKPVECDSRFIARAA